MVLNTCKDPIRLGSELDLRPVTSSGTYIMLMGCFIMLSNMMMNLDTYFMIFQ